MAGSISLSLSQQFNSLGKPLSGGLLYFYQAGTVATPQNAYQDSALTIPHPNPLTLDTAGRVPQLYFADGSIKVYLTDENGVPQISADNILVVGASSGGGGGSSVDPTTILQPGWLQPIYGTGTVTGFVRANGRTIGNASSGATERANADTLALFTFLYNADANLSVSGGRGASAAVDYAANKSIALPDFRGRVIAGLDDMGNSAAGRLTASYFGSSATVLGAVGQSNENSTLQTANLPAYTPSGTNSGTVAQFSATIASAAQSGSNLTVVLALSGGTGLGTGITTTVTQPTFTGTAQGGTSTPVRTVQPTMLATIYIKL